MKTLFSLLVLFAPVWASAQSLPGWRCYFSNSDEFFVDKEKGQYFITDGEFDIYPYVRFQDISFATEITDLLSQLRRSGEIHACQFNPTYYKPYFSYIYALGYKALPRETCISINGVVVRYNSAIKKNYISSSANSNLIAGPFDKAQEAQDARIVIEQMQFTQHCTINGSNFAYFKRRL